MAQPTPAPGEFIHPTQIGLTCNFADPLTAEVTATFTCSGITVTDLWTSSPSTKTAPRGQASLVVDSTVLATCTLQPDLAGQPFSTCAAFSATWQPHAPANVGGHTLMAQYVPDSTDLGKHASTTLILSQSLTVISPLTVTFATTDAIHTTACYNPETIPGLQVTQVETGHPEICRVRVTDGVGNPVSGVNVHVSDFVNPPAGTAVANTYISCYTHNGLWTTVACPDPSKKLGQFDGVTGDGTQGNPPAGELWFVYRRYYDGLAKNVMITLSATADGAPQTAQQNITVVPPTKPHWTETVVGCDTSVTGTQGWPSSDGQAVKTVTALSGPPNTPINCTTIVFDTDQTYFQNGNPDEEDLYSPYGTVYWLDESNPQNPVIASCQLNPALAAMPAAYLPNNSKPKMTSGALPGDASGCHVSLTLAGNLTLKVSYIPTTAPVPGHQDRNNGGPTDHNIINASFP
jgi:hypothetical protein